MQVRQQIEQIETPLCCDNYCISLADAGKVVEHIMSALKKM